MFGKNGDNVDELMMMMNLYTAMFITKSDLKT